MRYTATKANRMASIQSAILFQKGKRLEVFQPPQLTNRVTNRSKKKGISNSIHQWLIQKVKITQQRAVMANFTHCLTGAAATLAFSLSWKFAAGTAVPSLLLLLPDS